MKSLTDIVLGVVAPQTQSAIEQLRETGADLEALTFAFGQLLLRFPHACELSADLRQLDNLVRLSAQGVDQRISRLTHESNGMLLLSSGR